MIFRNREEAGRRLAETLAALRGENPLVLAIPRGALVMGRILAIPREQRVKRCPAGVLAKSGPPTSDTGR